MMLAKFPRPDDFAEAFGEPLSLFVETKIAAMDLRYRELTTDERDDWLLRILREIDKPLAKAGQHRKEEWERGWAAHAAMVKADPSPRSLIPGYFGKYPVVRWDGELIYTLSANYEYRCFEALQWWVFDKWMKGAAHILEYGCGTSHNLLRLKEANPSANVVGFDWAQASYLLVEENPTLFAAVRHGGCADFCEPDSPKWRKTHPPETIVFTCAALEQVGDGFRPFVDNLLRSDNPPLCVHIEPVAELLDRDSLLDHLSIRYAEKRGYLRGFLTYLRELEAQGRVEILAAQRTGVGSLFLDGYQLICWRSK